jgi:hypothetical protein
MFLSHEKQASANELRVRIENITRNFPYTCNDWRSKNGHRATLSRDFYLAENLGS